MALSITETETTGAEAAGGFVHRAVVYRDDEDYVRRLAPFLAAGVAGGEAVLVMAGALKVKLLKEAMGHESRGVVFRDVTELGANPAWILPAWHAFLERHRAAGRPMRGVGESVWPGRRAPEVAECQIHEALLNIAVPATVPLQLVCPYDGQQLPADILAEVQRVHRDDRTPPRPAERRAAVRHLRQLFGRSLPAPPAHALVMPFRAGDLRRVREVVAAQARPWLRVGHRQDRLVLAVHELATNSVVHGPGGGVLRVWRDGEGLACEVTDEGCFADATVGRLPPGEEQLHGRGVWLAHQLCDLVQVRSGPAGTAVRVWSWLA